VQRTDGAPGDLPAAGADSVTGVGRGQERSSVDGSGSFGEELVVGDLGWLTVTGCALCGATFWRLASQESRARKRALIDQTLEYERMAREPRD